MSTGPADPSDDDLRAAWRQRRGDTWPDTFERSMESALLSRLVREHAKRIARMRQFHLQALDTLPVTKPAISTSRTTPSLDGKSLASGEKPDKD